MIGFQKGHSVVMMYPFYVYVADKRTIRSFDQTLITLIDDFYPALTSKSDYSSFSVYRKPKLVPPSNWSVTLLALHQSSTE